MEYRRCMLRLLGILLLQTHEKKLGFIKICVKIKGKIPSYQEFEANFKEICYTDKITKQKDLVKYILSKIHTYYTQDKVINYDLMTIEHILPQSKVGTNAINEKNVGQLGNLILVPSGLNNELGNKNFLDKKRILETKNVLLDEKVKSQRLGINSILRKEPNGLQRRHIKRYGRLNDI